MQKTVRVRISDYNNSRLPNNTTQKGRLLAEALEIGLEVIFSREETKIPIHATEKSHKTYVAIEATEVNKKVSTNHNITIIKPDSESKIIVDDEFKDFDS